MDLISIIVPIYNASRYLRKCLDSIINQTYKNLEIILVNDGSTDESSEICNEYAMNDRRIVLINKNNEGVSVARNKGIEISTGKYITFIDSDDYVSNDYISNLYSCMISNKVDLVISTAIDIKEDGNIIEGHNKKDIFMDRERCLIELLSEDNFSHVCWGNLYKRSLLEGCYFDSKYRIAEDLDFLYKYISKINSAYFMSKKSYYWVIRETSVTHTMYSDKWNDELEVCKSIIDNTYYLKNDIYKYSIRKYIIANLNQAIRFNLNKEQANLIRNNIRCYKKEIFKFKEFSKISKLKIILLLNSYRIFKFIYNITKIKHIFIK